MECISKRLQWENMLPESKTRKGEGRGVGRGRAYGDSPHPWLAAGIAKFENTKLPQVLLRRGRNKIRRTAFDSR